MVPRVYLHDHETSNTGDSSHTEAVKLGARASTGASGAGRGSRGRRRGAGTSSGSSATRGRGGSAAAVAARHSLADLLRDGLGFGNIICVAGGRQARRGVRDYDILLAALTSVIHRLAVSSTGSGQETGQTAGRQLGDEGGDVRRLGGNQAENGREDDGLELHLEVLWVVEVATAGTG